MSSLAVQYRPHTFEEVIGQTSIIKVLKKQIETHNISNNYLFCGPSGTGKTTLARILSNEINHGQGNPIEIDGASNNGVDNVREIIEDAQRRSLDSEYKIYILDECHSLTIQAWQSFLKCIEEPPKYTIFIFCTTNPEKVPNTIRNRVQQFVLTKVPSDLIEDRLRFICEKEGATNFKETCNYISKLCNGGCRDAIADLEKCLSFSKDLSIENTLPSLGNFKHDNYINTINYILDSKDAQLLELIDNIYASGLDLKLYIDQLLDFIIDVSKYSLTKDLMKTKIPSVFKDKVDNIVGDGSHSNYFIKLMSKILDIKNAIKNDTNPRLTISTMLVNIGKK